VCRPAADVDNRMLYDDDEEDTRVAVMDTFATVEVAIVSVD
jgi:hypothetical protein